MTYFGRVYALHLGYTYKSAGLVLNFLPLTQCVGAAFVMAMCLCVCYVYLCLYVCHVVVLCPNDWFVHHATLSDCSLAILVFPHQILLLLCSV